jgi:hypothetical protein
LHQFFTAPGVATRSNMPGNIRKNQAMSLVTLRHRMTMSGVLVIQPAKRFRGNVSPIGDIRRGVRSCRC